MTDKFNENLKQVRQDANMTQAEVAERIGVAKNTYCNWELGTREPNIINIKALARLFDVSVDYLVGMEKYAVIYDMKNRYGKDGWTAYVEALQKLTEPNK